MPVRLSMQKTIMSFKRKSKLEQKAKIKSSFSLKIKFSVKNKKKSFNQIIYY